ncbi:MAG: NCS2 family permease [Limnospira sp. PMC 1291.21]|uniref:NCS2 family permease n=1 Tax=Limnospira TaxID=2596745 RepID=UPI00028040DB|nr:MULTISPECIES: NCS2 family permease [unclassified Limnospira]EKD06177.1 xanthine/uracil/vitamin C permease [Arthrospira platensis C1]MDT9177640.1 NCS2 family permease [Limnospira sp. PMC 1238.20]MDT9192991.1 NCS2 family permease [Limnospira sp. PMC 1245.20]MDT9205243.1 NCS2 family permease [Limnospira sp. PMC 1243.20]MDT9208451.1 NCS2 family permease [Limnospira sp. PMC 1252.20]
MTENSPSQENAISKFFQFQPLQTNLRTEIVSGVTTFVTMAYILAVNPDILSNAIFLETPGDLFGEIAIATALSAAIATLIMGLYANYPFALAPGMGLNAYFAFSVVLSQGISWRVALGAIFIEGLIFIALTFGNIRAQIVTAIPSGIKHATAAGIGLFIAYIALTKTGLIISSEATVTTLGDLSQPTVLITLIGILITAAFVVRRITGALLWGIIATALLGWILGIAPWPQGFMSLPQFPRDLFGQAFVGLGGILQGNFGQLITVIFVFLFVDLFDTVGTLTGLGMKTGYINEKGELPRANRAFIADAVGTTIGGILGTSTVTTYIESASGISEGGRSGFNAITVAVLFLLSMLFIPLLAGIPSFATAPTLIIVGVLMMASVRSIAWDDPAESISAFLTLFIMPLSYSIADGLAAGLIAYPILKTLQGKWSETTIAMWVLAAIFVLKFVLVGG